MSRSRGFGAGIAPGGGGGGTPAQLNADQTSLVIPSGAGDGTTPATGHARVNTTLNRLRVFVSGAWRSFVRLDGDTMTGALVVQDATAANSITITGAATGFRPSVLATGTDANISMVVGPKGAGAFVTQMPDSTNIGGNARGANAVDLQMSRTAAGQVASGQRTFLAGINSTASGDVSFAFGNAASASGYSSFALGEAVAASGAYSVALGARSDTRGQFGRLAFAAGNFATGGDAQIGEHVFRRQTTDATATRLTADNAAASTLNTMNLPNFGAYGGQVIVQSKAVGTLDAATWIVQIGAVRGNGVATVVVYLGAGAAIVPTGSNGTGSTWRLAISADTTNGGINFSVTGAAATTINFVERGMTAETVTGS